MFWVNSEGVEAMLKVWVCLLFYDAIGTGTSYSPAYASVPEIARYEDCNRIGTIFVRHNEYAKFKCVQYYKVK